MKTVYGAKTCPACAVLKKQLEDKDEIFKYIDISTLSPNELVDLIEESKSLSLPIVLEK